MAFAVQQQVSLLTRQYQRVPNLMVEIETLSEAAGKRQREKGSPACSA